MFTTRKARTARFALVLANYRVPRVALRAGCGAFVTTRISHCSFSWTHCRTRRVQIVGCYHNLYKPSRCADLYKLAHPARFERAIPAFGGRCSIQLSHGCFLAWQYYIALVVKCKPKSSYLATGLGYCANVCDTFCIHFCVADFSPMLQQIFKFHRRIFYPRPRQEHIRCG